MEDAIGGSGPSSYRAPEDGAGAPVTDGLDVFGLAAVAAELLTGRDPSPSNIEALPEPLHNVIQTGLAPDPSHRHATVDAFVAAVVAAAGQPEPAAVAERADFFDHPLLDGRLGNVVADAHLTLAVPGADALLESIEGPAALVGLSLERWPTGRPPSTRG